MTKEATYARALRALIEEHPAQATEYLHNLGQLLARRNERKLLPRIVSQYQKIEESRRRSERYRRITPADVRARALVELYRALVASGSFSAQ